MKEQMSLFDEFLKDYKINKKIKLIEFFALRIW